MIPLFQSQIAKALLISACALSLAACSAADKWSFSAKDAASEAVALGALSAQGADAFIDFAKAHGADAPGILQERYAQYQSDIELEAMAVYEETFSKEEMEYLGRMYGTQQGREILRKHSVLYPKLALIGEDYALKIMSNPGAP